VHTPRDEHDRAENDEEAYRSNEQHVVLVPQEQVQVAVEQRYTGGDDCGAAAAPQDGEAVAAGVALLYGYLYLLLRNEDYALLIGSIGLFVILGAIMFVTRRVDWYAAGMREQSGSSHAHQLP